MACMNTPPWCSNSLPSLLVQGYVHRHQVHTAKPHALFKKATRVKGHITCNEHMACIHLKQSHACTPVLDICPGVL